ncbi:GNAT family N-acetyltransferase [Roseateles violae]|uniref:GNAT family N-acetyltransferase n=1 Tax=Roseateles violae TaxID=3058042 RepID=A0ABT8DZ63_9BURK|nr:GNAT family N-acetyltransferase [Pelomonas sp. PFR6]MDN3922890.1 GNAT family N-acetyltransferase [Pelomonas sp. PFR6]
MTDPLRWTCAPAAELSTSALYQALALRAQVFVVEQHCVFLDPDGLDLRPGAWQLLGHDGQGDLMVCARLLAPGIKGARQVHPMISRVVNAPAARGQGLGRRLMERAIAECTRRWPGLPIDIGAQAYLQRFYASLGFEPLSALYDEDGIPHLDMRRPAA